ncbi:hypothetical protein GJ496_008779 [Pomphorhynchus laevis]|nr:hypothetical protein GJ496_008779 [Pomphorhynchus laevis]
MPRHLCDVREMNVEFDSDNRPARLHVMRSMYDNCMENDQSRVNRCQNGMDFARPSSTQAKLPDITNCAPARMSDKDILLIIEANKRDILANMQAMLTQFVSALGSSPGIKPINVSASNKRGASLREIVHKKKSEIPKQSYLLWELFDPISLLSAADAAKTQDVTLTIAQSEKQHKQ